MSRRDDLEQNIRECYEIIREYEFIQRDTNRPEERKRSERIIGRQWQLTEEHFAECQLRAIKLYRLMHE